MTERDNDMHWYIRNADGHAQRFVSYKKNGEPAKNVKRADALAAGAVLGVTDILDKGGSIGGLLDWCGRIGVDCGIDAAMRNMGAAADAIREFGYLLFGEKREEAAERGKAFHEAIEQAVRGLGFNGTDKAIESAVRNVQSVLSMRSIEETINEVCFVARVEEGGRVYAFGGTPDLVSPGWIVDYKTKSNAKKVAPALKELAQLAAYRKGLNRPEARCLDLYIARETGEILLEQEWSEEQLELGWRYFRLCFDLTAIEDEFAA